ncbi:MAG: helix-turn-helix transcriptional regulator [Solobacterium sp.]|nr:helix-turn-helix transcriptional regulator [Solobacterium sp.]
MTKTYLSALFRKETGLTFSEYVRRQRLSAAADLLKATQMTVEEIASYCGIPDANCFTRLFRREYGMSPVKYRASARQ